jgi:hypothetical protein
MSTPRDIKTGVPQGSVMSPTLYKLYVNGTPQTTGVNLALFADDTCLYATERNGAYVLRKLQRGLNSMAAWCKNWNTKINEEKFGQPSSPIKLESHLTLNGRNIVS